MSWEELADLSREKNRPADLVNGPTTSQARLRLFGRSEASDVRVTLYRDHHAWCPYCHKVWLWLEEKRVPYRVRKVTMFCYGEKEAWYRKICPSGMLPAVQFRSGEVVTDSDQILRELEARYGPVRFAAPPCQNPFRSRVVIVDPADETHLTSANAWAFVVGGL